MFRYSIKYKSKIFFIFLESKSLMLIFLRKNGAIC